MNNFLQSNKMKQIISINVKIYKNTVHFDVLLIEIKLLKKEELV